MDVLLPTALGLFLAAIAVAFGDNLLFSHKENDNGRLISGGESNTVIGTWTERESDSLCDDFIQWRRNVYSSGTTYGSKTGYLFKERVIQDESSVKHSECRVVQVSVLSSSGIGGDSSTHCWVDNFLHVYIYMSQCH